MKSFTELVKVAVNDVTLSVRVWIEMFSTLSHPGMTVVTLSVRVWIEIPKSYSTSAAKKSHPQCEGVD